MGTHGRHRPFLQGPGHEQRPPQRCDTGAMFTPDVIEPEQLFHLLADEFALPMPPLQTQAGGQGPGPGV